MQKGCFLFLLYILSQTTFVINTKPTIFIQFVNIVCFCYRFFQHSELDAIMQGNSGNSNKYITSITLKSLDDFSFQLFQF
jgi:hypothetical protein